MQKGRYLLLSLIALGSIPSSLAQNAETTGDKNAHHIIVPITTKSLAGVVSGDPSKPGGLVETNIPRASSTSRS